MRDVTIDELVLRLPGVREADARWIAGAVAARLAATAPGWRDGGAAFASIRIRVPAGARRDEFARHVADEIARALR